MDHKPIRTWYFQDSARDIEKGPYRAAQLKAFARRSIITKASLVRRNDWAQPRRAKDVPGLLPGESVDSRPRTQQRSKLVAGEPIAKPGPTPRLPEKEAGPEVVTVACRACGYEHRVPQRFVGRSFACKGCGLALDVMTDAEIDIHEDDLFPDTGVPTSGMRRREWQPSYAAPRQRHLAPHGYQTSAWGEVAPLHDRLHSIAPEELERFKKRDEALSFVFGLGGFFLVLAGRTMVEGAATQEAADNLHAGMSLAFFAHVCGACFAARSKGLHTASGLWAIWPVIGWIYLVAQRRGPYTEAPTPLLTWLGAAFLALACIVFSTAS